jgi:hypothetical protein
LGSVRPLVERVEQKVILSEELRIDGSEPVVALRAGSIRGGLLHSIPSRSFRSR